MQSLSSNTTRKVKQTSFSLGYNNCVEMLFLSYESSLTALMKFRHLLEGLAHSPEKEHSSPQTRTGKQGQRVLTIFGLDEYYYYTIQVLRSEAVPII